MGWPLPPNVNQPMVALRPLIQASWGGRLPNVTVGETFWASAADAGWLAANGYARAWVAGSDGPLPPPEPRWTAHGSAGFGAGTSNSSH